MTHPLYVMARRTRTEAEFLKLLEITFTESEHKMILERWDIFRGFQRGLTQREIARKTGASIVTVTRGAKAYRDNKKHIDKFLTYLKNS